MAEEKKTKAEEKVVPVDPWSVMKPIFLPRAQAGESKTQYVSVNSRDFLVPKGKQTEVPLPVYEVLERVLEAEAKEHELMREVDGLDHEL